jgi:hypothetical protein
LFRAKAQRRKDTRHPKPVRPELVEGFSFLLKIQRKCFDKLSTKGAGQKLSVFAPLREKSLLIQKPLSYKKPYGLSYDSQRTV